MKENTLDKFKYRSVVLVFKFSAMRLASSLPKWFPSQQSTQPAKTGYQIKEDQWFLED